MKKNQGPGLQKKYLISQVVGMVIALTIFFAFDDFLMIALMQEMDIIRTQRWLYYVFYFLGLLGSLLLALTVMAAMRRQPVTGEEGLIGRRGTVVESRKTGYVVKVDGEIWQATSKQKLAKGEKVVVTAVNGLQLDVVGELDSGRSL